MGADKAVHVEDERPARHRRASAPRWCWPRRSRRAATTWSSPAWRRRTAPMGVVPALLAERLGVPQVTLLSEVTVEGGDRHGPPRRRRRDRELEASLPRCVSVTDQSGEARYPSFKGIMAAKKKPVAVLGPGGPGDRRRTRSASTAPGPRSTPPRRARRAPRARSSRTRARAASSWPSSWRARSSSEPASTPAHRRASRFTHG